MVHSSKHREAMSETVGPYKIMGTLGQGSFAKVKYSLNTKTGEEVAIKIFDRSKLQRKDEKMVQKEIGIMKMLHHRNVLELKDVLWTEQKIYVVLEFAKGGDLFDQIVSMGKFDEDVARNYFQQLVEGVHYCHHLNVCHRDLKPDNLLLDGNGVLKLSDFGLSTIFEPTKDNMLQTKCGSLACSAPEVVLAPQYDGVSADIWSCGCILYALLAGNLPFEENVEMKAQRLGIYDIPDWISPGGAAFLRKLLDPDPRKRVRFEDMKKDAWFRKDLQLSQGPGYMPQGVDRFQNLETQSADNSLNDKSTKPALVNPPWVFAQERLNALIECLVKHKQPDINEKDEKDSAPALALSDLHVLVVDDQALDRLLVQKGLKKFTYRTTAAENGRKALQILKDKAESDPIHLVLADVVNPDMDGFEFLTTIKSNELFRDIPVIMVSSTGHGDIVEKCIKNGASDFFLKPVRLQQLRNVWQHIWTRKVLVPADMSVDNMNVLVVDDQRVDREIVARLLMHNQYTVTVAENGQVALDILQRQPSHFNLVLADVQMPDMDGYQLLQRIRNTDLLAEIPVIMMSSETKKDNVTDAIQYGADDYLVKPLRKMKIKDLLQNVHFLRIERAEKNRRRQLKDVVHWKRLAVDSVYRQHCQEVAILQQVSLTGMERNEALSFFLNLFNILMIHGSINLGIHIGELGSDKRRDFFTGTSYQIGQFQISLDDIEHGILRGNRPRPWSLKRPFSKSDPRMALVVNDPDARMFFGLSYLTVSSPALTVFTPESLDIQLTAAARLFCNEFVTLNPAKKEVVLPKVFQWYQADFGKSRQELIAKVSEWLGPPRGEQLSQMAATGSLNVKYNEYIWDLKVKAVSFV